MVTARVSRHDFLRLGLRTAMAGGMISILAACSSAAPAAPTTAPSTGGAAPTPAPRPTTAAAAPTAAAQSNAQSGGKTTLTLFGANGLSTQEIDYWKANVIKPYEQANANISINFVNADTNKLLVDLAGNLPPDVIDIETKNLASFAMRGAMADVTSRVMTSKVNKEDYSGPDIEKVIFNGKWYGIPWDTAPAVLYYNKKIFDSAGVTYPTQKWGDSAWTWDSFLAMCHKLTSGSGPAQVFGFGPTNWWVYWMPWVWENGADFNDSTGQKITITDPGFQEAFTFYANLISKEKVGPSPAQSSIGVDQMFFTGKIGMFSSGSYFSVGLDKEMGTEWDVAAYPMNKKVATRSPADCHALAKAGKNQDAAWDMVLWLTGETGQTAYAQGGYTPVLKSVLATDAFLQKSGHVNRQVLADPLIMGITHHTAEPIIYPQVNNLFTTPMNNLLRGSTTVEQLVTSLQPQIQKLLDAVPQEWQGVA